jgi:hypothetical protein
VQVLHNSGLFRNRNSQMPKDPGAWTAQIDMDIYRGETTLDGFIQRSFCALSQVTLLHAAKLRFVA